MRTALLLLSIIQTMIMKRLILAWFSKIPIAVGVFRDHVNRVHRALTFDDGFELSAVWITDDNA